MSEALELELLNLLEEEYIINERESCPDILAPVRAGLRDDTIEVIVLEGGRGGGKSWTLADMLLEVANEKKVRIFCGREIQNSIDDSVKKLLRDRIEHLRYSNFSVQDKLISHKNGSEFKFKGFRGQGSATSRQNIKGFEGADYMWNDEAQSTSQESLDVLEPTIRKPGSKLIYTMNRLEEEDPVFKEHCKKPRPDVLHIKINYYDNPYCPQKLVNKALRMKEDDYKRYLHIYEGLPQAQGADSVLSRELIRKAMDRVIVDPVGSISIGCDPADMGDDTTQIYKKHGLKVIGHKSINFSTGKPVADAIGQMIKNDPSIEVRLDGTGIGTSARDFCREKGLKTIPIHFAESARDKNKYANVVTEMWFKFGELLEAGEIDIPDDPELMQELAGRKYKYDTKGRYVLEKKDDFKKRIGRSPDKGDALVLLFYQGGKVMLSEEARVLMRNLWTLTFQLYNYIMS